MSRVAVAVMLLLSHAAVSGEAMGKPQPAEQARRGFAAAKEHPVKAELIAEYASIRPGGQTRVGVHFDIEPGWHIYAKDPGDAGFPTRITWACGEDVPCSDVVFGELRWPPSEHFTDPGDIRTHGYSNSVVLFSTMTVSSRYSHMLPDADIRIGAHVEWLACKEICVPGKADLNLNLPVSPEAPALTAHAELFDHARP